MKESRQYLLFFQKNFLLVLLTSLFFALIGWYLAYQTPVQYLEKQLFEMEFKQANISERIALTDTVVVILRSNNFLKQQYINRETISVYKSSPLTIEIATIDRNQDYARKTLVKIERFLLSNYSVHLVGQKIETKVSANYLKNIFLSTSLGFLIGIVLSALKSYFENF